MTEKLYWSEPLATTFEVVLDPTPAILESAGELALVLPRTLFYPEGGGQLGDAGSLTIGGRVVRVRDTQIDDAGAIRHVLETDDATRLAEELRSAGGKAIIGTIDEARRRDHTVQHTAQHALSRALADAARAETVSARLGEGSCTIDVKRVALPDADLHRAEDLVNAVVASDVQVRISFPTIDELARLPLRKRPSVTESVRVVDIEGFDVTPCGGTHVARTGQIGQIRIVGAEKYKGMTRLTFHAGPRALADARSRHEALGRLATELTCGPFDVAAAVAKLRADLKSVRGELATAREELATLVARAHTDALTGEGPWVVAVLRPQEDLASLRVLANKLTQRARVVALVGTDDAATGDLAIVLQRGEGTTVDCGAFLLGETKARGGRGGGKAERAEGRFSKGTTLEALAAALRAAMER